MNGATVRGAVAIADKAVPLVNPGFAQSIAPTPIATASQAGLPQSLRYSQNTDLAPRFGFAFRPFGNDNTVIRGGWGRFIDSPLGALIDGAWAVEASDVATFNQQIVGGRPTLVFPQAFPSNIAQPGTQNFQLAFALHYKDPYVNEWNLTLERDLGFHTGIRLSSLGSHGANLGETISANELYPNTLGYAAALKNAPFPQFYNIVDLVNGARSNYNAVTIALNKRMSGGLQFQTSYTFARNLTKGAGTAPTAFVGQGGGTATHQYDFTLDYGNVASTRRNRFQTTFLYTLPLGRGHAILASGKGVVNQAVSNWEMARVLLFQSGPFLTAVNTAADPSGTSLSLSGTSRVDMVPGVSPYPANQTPGAWLNPAGFSITANNIGRFGYEPVGYVTGPRTECVSLFLMESVSITERARLRFGAQASNAFHHPKYGNPNLTLGTAAFGTITSLQGAEGAGPRALQLTARLSF